MSKYIHCALVVIGAMASGAGHAAQLATGTYASTGKITANNKNASCAAIGFNVGAVSDSVLILPAVGHTGVAQYFAAPGFQFICTASAAIPATGLASYTSPATCNILQLAANGKSVTQLGKVSGTLSFSLLSTDTLSAVGTYTLTLAKTSSVGAGCSETTTAALVRTGN